MELKQLISVDYLRENFTEVAGRIARYGEVYVIQNDTPKYVIRPLEEGDSAPPALSREAERAAARSTAAARRLSAKKKKLMLRKLSSTGKGVFVTYYEHFKGQEDPMVFLAREDFTVQSKRARASTARYIFRQGWQHHALRYIIQIGRAAPEVIQKAREILEREADA